MVNRRPRRDMSEGVDDRLNLARASWIGAAASGVVGATVISGSITLFGSSPTSTSLALAGWAGAAIVARSLKRPPPLLLVASLIFFACPGEVGRALHWMLGYRSAAVALALLATGAAAVLLTPWSQVAAHSLPLVICGLTFLICAWLPPCGLLVLLLLGATVGTRVGAGASASDHGAPWAAVVVAAIVNLSLVSWAIGRAPLDPSPAAAIVLVGAGLAGWGLAGTLALRPRAALAVFGVAVAAATVWHGTSGRVALLALMPSAGLFLATSLGLAAGAIAGPARGPRVLFGAALGAALTPASVSLLPASLLIEFTRGDAVNLAQSERVSAMREQATLVWAGLDSGGSGAIYEAKERTFVELDGLIVDADTRQGRAERFAGSLAACVTSTRTRARVSGDDMGQVVEGLLPHGFLAIDSAVPSPGLARALAGRRSTLDRNWLAPAVHLIVMPGPFVARVGPAADVVVEIVRAPWATARATLPDARAVALTRRTLRPGGAHVVAVSNRVGLDALRGVVDAFARAYTHPSVWLPPEGADTALIIGTDAPIPWSGIERCVSADASGLRAQSIRSGVDLGALAMADANAIAGMREATWPDPLSFSRAPEDVPPLARLPAPGADPRSLFIGAPAELDARADTRALFLQMLAEATGGDARSAFEQARALAALPGGDRALEPILRPHLDRARRAIARGTHEGLASKAWEEAEAALTTARTLAPSHAGTRCLEGELSGARGDLARAEDAFAQCAQLDPQSIDAQQGLARARRSRGDMAGTEEALRAAARLDPQAWQTAHNLGLFLLDVQRYDDAERMLKQAMAAQSRQDSTITVSSLALARLYLATARPELALAQAQRAVGIQPSATGLALRGAARLELHEPRLAEADFSEALRLDNTDVLARFGMGQLHATRGQYALAARAFKDVLAKDPRNAEARESLQRLIPLLEAEKEE